MTTPGSQLPPTIIAALPEARTESWSGALVLTSREAEIESVFWTFCHSARPAREPFDVRSPVHLPPDWVAIWPPLAHSSGMPAYQYSPGR